MVYETIVKCGKAYIKNDGIMETLQAAQSVRNLLEWGYQIVLSRKLVEPIEKCENKQEYWNEALKLNLSREERIKVAKGLYFLTYLSY